MTDAEYERKRRIALTAERIAVGFAQSGRIGWSPSDVVDWAVAVAAQLQDAAPYPEED